MSLYRVVSTLLVELREDESHRVAPRSSGDATLLAILMLLASVPYLNTLLNSFVYDDINQVTRNPYIQSFHHLGKVFSTTVWSFIGHEGVTNYYRPMMTLGYLLCYQLFGLLAYYFHLFNVVLHVAVVCVLFAATKVLFRDRTLAFVAAAVFALHPIHTESVAWIAAVTDVELTFFYLLTFWFFLGLAPYAHSASAGRRVVLRQVGMVLSFVCAVLSKEQALTLPILVAVYEHAYRQDRAQTTFLQKIGRYGALWALAAAYVVLRIRFLGAFAPALKHADLTRYEASLSAIALVGEYLWKLIWPVHLCAFYVFHKSSSLMDPRVLAGLGGIILVGALFAWLRGLLPSLRARSDAEATGRLSTAQMSSFGLIWLFATLAPMLNVRWLPANAFTERYLYLPSVGFCWLVASAWMALRARSSSQSRALIWRWALTTGLVIIGGACAARIVTRNRDWRNEIVLFNKTLEASPDAYQIRTNLGAAYWAQGDVQDAEREWREAIKFAPDSPVILNNLGLVCTKKKQYEQAVEFFRKSIHVKPDYTDAQLNLGIAYEEMGLKKQAELQYQTAVGLSPLNVSARNRLGRMYFEEARLADAEQQFAESLKSEPNPEGFDGLGDVHLRRGDRDLAARAFRASLKLNPIDSHAHFQLGALEMAEGKNAEALKDYEAGLESDPANSEAQAALKRLKAQISDAKPEKP